jgi:CubicO group peptidase (beta-lactamase class C family)
MRLAPLSFVFVLACDVAPIADEPSPPPVIVVDPCAAHRAQLDAIAAAFDDERTSKGIPAAAIAVTIDECMFARGFGVERAGGATVDEHTRFQLASLSKTFTAMTALSLEEDGLLDRARPVRELVPATTSTATLDHLLSHRAGYPTDLPQSASLDLRTFIEDNDGVPMWAPPDEVWLYSNPGFALAGLALESAGGAPFEQLVRERIFEPAGMTDAVMGAELTGSEDKMAHGNGGDPSAPQSIAPTDRYLASTYYGPMGGVFASAHDLARFMRAFMTEDVLATSSLDDMATSRGAAYGPYAGYGQGVFVTYDGVLQHGGSVFGYLSEMDVHRASGVGVAVVSAADWDFPSDVLLDALAELAAPSGELFEVDAPSEDDIVGTYVDAAVLGDIEVVREGALRIRIASQDVDEQLVPWGAGSYGFFYAEWGMEMEASFQRGRAGDLYVVTLLGVGAR